MSNYSLAVLALLVALLLCLVWTASGFAAGNIHPIEAVDPIALTRDLAFASACFILLALATFLPVRRSIASVMATGSGLLFVGAWHLLLGNFVDDLPVTLDIAGAFALPTGAGLMAWGLFQLGRAYRLSRLLLGSYRKIEHSLSTKDQLTQLFNRRYFYSNCPELLASCQKHNETCILISFLLENLPDINREEGVNGGDAALSELGRVLLNNTRHNDIAARLGGRRLALFLPNTDMASAGQIAQRILSLAEHVQVSDNEGVRRVLSLRIAHSIYESKPEEEFESLVQRTQAALNQAA